jgi:hypothetical protein
LLLLAPVIGTASQFSADEGAVIAQAERLERGDGWTMPNSFPAADPEGEAFPFELSSRTGDEYATFSKHPAYPVVLAAADRAGGRTAMVLLSVAGTVVAAVVTALLARRLDPGLAVPALWTVGIGSPLLFDGYVVIAHTLGAACAAGATLLVLRGLEERRWWWPAAGTAALLVAGVLLRTEMLFFGLALGVAVAVLTTRRSAKTWALAAAPAVSVIVGYALDRVLEGVVLQGGAATTVSVPKEPGGLVSGRVIAFAITWLLPSYSLDTGATLLLIVTVVSAVAVLLARRTPPERDGVRLFAVMAAVAAVARLALGGSAVPGLLIAFPLLLSGALAVRRSTFTTTTAKVLALTFALFAAGVAATQYGNGGSGEWGGRYFAVGLPLIVPVLLLAMRDLGRRLDRTTARIGLASAVVVSLALGALAVVTLRDAHRDTDKVVAALDAAAQQRPATDGGPPVVLTSSGALARFAFPIVDRYRWLTVPPERLAEYAQRLHDLGVGPVTFVSRDADEDLVRLRGLYAVTDEEKPAEGWTLFGLEPCADPNACSPAG